MKKVSFLLIICVIIGSLAGCGRVSAESHISAVAETVSPAALEKTSTTVFSMDTVMTLTAYGENREAGLQAAEKEINRLNDLFSIGVNTSEVSVANCEGYSKLTSDTEYVINRALNINRMTDGCFDITVTPLMELWGFTGLGYRVPSQKEIDNALDRTGIEKIELNTDKSYVMLSDGCAIDLGGIAKGYTSQRVMEIFSECGVTSAIVSLGGNAQCLGSKPDGSKWRIGIRSPWGSEYDIAAVLEVENKAVITSGGYERYFIDEKSGKTYIHILDPKTGYPIENDVESVSIISEDGTLADGLSTSLYIMGLDDASDFWRQYSDKFDMIIITSDHKIHVSNGISDSIGSIDASLELNIIK